MAPVTVNFNVIVDASGTVEVFGQAPTTMENVVVCEVTIGADTLYWSDSNAVFEFWEPSTALGDISGARKSDWTVYNYLRSELQNVIVGAMDASGAVPFNTAGYSSTEQYYKHTGFGRLALSMYAHYLFGHVAATAAITNDAAFIENMNGNDENIPGHALLAKKFTDAIRDMSDADVTAIVKQVLGQDASRAKDQDNNTLPPDVKHSLKFLAGDIIYIQITLKQPTVTVTSGAAVAQQSEPGASNVSEQTYALKITLTTI
jgi:hypothetical protein